MAHAWNVGFRRSIQFSNLESICKHLENYPSINTIKRKEDLTNEDKKNIGELIEKISKSFADKILTEININIKISFTVQNYTSLSSISRDLHFAILSAVKNYAEEGDGSFVKADELLLASRNFSISK